MWRHDVTCAFYFRQFANSDGIYCLFAGSLENFCQLRQAYGLPKSITEVQLVIEAYKVLRDRGPYSADQVVSDLKGNFTFVIYDSSSADVFASGVIIFPALYWISVGF